MDRSSIFEATKKINEHVEDMQGRIIHRADYPNIHEIIAAEKQAAIIQEQAEQIRQECQSYIAEAAKSALTTD